MTTPSQAKRPGNAAEAILDYLRTRLPAYPYAPDVDTEFVAELIDDFHDVNILDETKAFRWYYDNQPAQRLRNVRLGLRRWIANARNRRKNSSGTQ